MSLNKVNSELLVKTDNTVNNLPDENLIAEKNLNNSARDKVAVNSNTELLPKNKKEEIAKIRKEIEEINKRTETTVNSDKKLIEEAKKSFADYEQITSFQDSYFETMNKMYLERLKGIMERFKILEDLSRYIWASNEEVRLNFMGMSHKNMEKWGKYIRGEKD